MLNFYSGTIEIAKNHTKSHKIDPFILFQVPNSIASIMGKGKILQGDQLLEINGQSVRESNQKDVANQLNQLDGELVLLLGRDFLDSKALNGI